MLVEYFNQRSDQWHHKRIGRPTASQFSRIITTKGEPSKQRNKYMFQLAGEAVSGHKESTYQSEAMLRGIEMEGEARECYEVITGTTVEQVGICYPDERKLCSCSPDGLVGDDGGLEIKCPLIPTHVGYLLGNKLPTDYFQQVHGFLYVSGRKWIDFFSYSPGLRPLLVRVYRDEEFNEKLHQEILRFNHELDLVKKAIA